MGTPGCGTPEGFTASYFRWLAGWPSIQIHRPLRPGYIGSVGGRGGQQVVTSSLSGVHYKGFTVQNLLAYVHERFGEETARSAVDTSRRLTELFRSDLARIHTMGRGAGSAAIVHASLREKPLWTIQKLKEATALTVPTVTRSLEALQALGIVSETTGRRRGRVYSYDEYLRILNEGTQAA